MLAGTHKLIFNRVNKCKAPRHSKCTVWDGSKEGGGV